MIGPTQKPLPDNKQHTQEIDVPAPGGIRTRRRSKRVATDRRLNTALPPASVCVFACLCVCVCVYTVGNTE